MIKGLQDSELGQGQVGASETAGSAVAGRVGGAHQLDISAQRQTFLRSIGLSSAHDCLCLRYYNIKAICSSRSVPAITSARHFLPPVLPLNSSPFLPCPVQWRSACDRALHWR